MDCWKGYPKLGPSIFTPPCDNSSAQILFNKQKPGYFWLDKATRRSAASKKCPNRSKGHKRLKQTLSHYDLLQIKKTASFYDPKSFLQLNRHRYPIRKPCCYYF